MKNQKTKLLSGLIHALPWIACGWLSVAAALAQFESATLTGVVTDTAGAVIQGARVLARNEGTNLEASALSNEEGRFVFSSLRPGSYQVIASAKGFKQAVSSGLVLQVN